MTDMPETRLSQFFSAPPALLFQAWSSAQHIRNWFCPAGYGVAAAKIEFGVGGVFEVCWRGATGVELWCRGHFLEIIPPDRLVIEMDVIDDCERLCFTARTELGFLAEGFGTRLELLQSYRLRDAVGLPMIAGAGVGWQQVLDRLAQEATSIAEAAPAAHGVFRLERDYPFKLEDLWRAFTDSEAKSAWFSAPPDHCASLEREIDIRPNGRESLTCHWNSGMTSEFRAIYHEVIRHRRLIFSYEMLLDDRKISVSLATIEMAAQGDGCKLTVTEQGAFFNGYHDNGSRERGTADLLDRMAASLSK
jgi:uncharacterized protein YndB with AHSA1/START domain